MPQIESFKKTLRDIYYQYIIILWAVELNFYGRLENNIVSVVVAT